MKFNTQPTPTPSAALAAYFSLTSLRVFLLPVLQLTPKSAHSASRVVVIAFENALTSYSIFAPTVRATYCPLSDSVPSAGTIIF